MAFGFLKAPFKALGSVAKFAVKRLPQVGAGFLLGGPAGAGVALAESFIPGGGGAPFDPRFAGGGQFSRNPFESRTQRTLRLRLEAQQRNRENAARAATLRQQKAAEQRKIATAEAARVRLERLDRQRAAEREQERERERERQKRKNVLPIALGIGGGAIALVSVVLLAVRRPAPART